MTIRRTDATAFAALTLAGCDHDKWAGIADEPEPEAPRGRRGRDAD